jgi:alpha-glucosidase
MPWAADAPHADFSSVEPWLPIDWRHHALAVDLQHGVAGSTLETTRELLRLRREYGALRTGAMRFARADDAVLVHERTGEPGVLCVFNLAEGERTCPLPAGAWRVLAGTPGHDAEVRDRAVLPRYGWFWARSA